MLTQRKPEQFSPLGFEEGKPLWQGMWLGDAGPYDGSFAQLYNCMELVSIPDSHEKLKSVFDRSIKRLVSSSVEFPPPSTEAASRLKQNKKTTLGSDTKPITDSGVGFLCSLAKDILEMDEEATARLYHFHLAPASADEHAPLTIAACLEMVCEERRCRVQCLCALLRLANDEANEAFQPLGLATVQKLCNQALPYEIMKELTTLNSAEPPPGVVSSPELLDIWQRFHTLQRAALTECIFLLFYVVITGSPSMFLSVLHTVTFPDTAHPRSHVLSVLTLAELLRLEDALSMLQQPGLDETASSTHTLLSTEHITLLGLCESLMQYADPMHCSMEVCAIRSVVLLAFAALLQIFPHITSKPVPGVVAERANTLVATALHNGALTAFIAIAQDPALMTHSNATAYKSVCQGITLAVHRAFVPTPFSAISSLLCRGFALVQQGHPELSSQLWATENGGGGLACHPSPLDLAIAEFPHNFPLLPRVVAALMSPSGQSSSRLWDLSEDTQGVTDPTALANISRCFHLLSQLPSLTVLLPKSVECEVDGYSSSNNVIVTQGLTLDNNGPHVPIRSRATLVREPQGTAGALVKVDMRWDAWPVIVSRFVTLLRCLAQGKHLPTPSDDAVACCVVVHAVLIEWQPETRPPQTVPRLLTLLATSLGHQGPIDASVIFHQVAQLIVQALGFVHSTPESLHFPLVRLLVVLVARSPAASAVVAEACSVDARSPGTLIEALLGVVTAVQHSHALGSEGSASPPYLHSTESQPLFPSNPSLIVCAHLNLMYHLARQAALHMPFHVSTRLTTSTTPVTFHTHILRYVAATTLLVNSAGSGLLQAWRWRVLALAFRIVRLLARGAALEGPDMGAVEDALMHAVQFSSRDWERLSLRGHYGDVEAVVECLTQAYALVAAMVDGPVPETGERFREHLCASHKAMQAILTFAVTSELPLRDPSHDVPCLASSLLATLSRPSACPPHHVTPLATSLATTTFPLTTSADTERLDNLVSTAMTRFVTTEQAVRLNSLLEFVHAAVAHQSGLTALLLRSWPQPASNTSKLTARDCDEPKSQASSLLGVPIESVPTEKGAVVRTLLEVANTDSTAPRTRVLAISCLRVAHTRLGSRLRVPLSQLCDVFANTASRFTAKSDAVRGPSRLLEAGFLSGSLEKVLKESENSPMVVGLPSGDKHPNIRCDAILCFSHLLRMIASEIHRARSDPDSSDEEPQTGFLACVEKVWKILPALLRSLNHDTRERNLARVSVSLWEELESTNRLPEVWSGAVSHLQHCANVWRSHVLTESEGHMALTGDYMWRVSQLTEVSSTVPASVLQWLQDISTRISASEAQTDCIAAISRLVFLSRDAVSPNLSLAMTHAADEAATGMWRATQAEGDTLSSDAVGRLMRGLGANMCVFQARAVRAVTQLILWLGSPPRSAPETYWWGPASSSSTSLSSTSRRGSAANTSTAHIPSLLATEFHALIALQVGGLRTPEQNSAWREGLAAVLILLSSAMGMSAHKTSPVADLFDKVSAHALLGLVANGVAEGHALQESCAVLATLIPHCETHSAAVVLAHSAVPHLLGVLQEPHHTPTSLILAALQLLLAMARTEGMCAVLMAQDVVLRLTHSLDSVLYGGGGGALISPHSDGGEVSEAHVVWCAVLRLVCAMCLAYRPLPTKLVEQVIRFVQVHHKQMLHATSHDTAFSSLSALREAQLTTRLCILLSHSVPAWLSANPSPQLHVECRFGPRLPLLVQQCLGLLPHCASLLGRSATRSNTLLPRSALEAVAAEAKTSSKGRPTPSPAPPSPMPSTVVPPSPYSSIGTPARNMSDTPTPSSPYTQSPQSFSTHTMVEFPAAVQSVILEDIPPALRNQLLTVPPPCPSTSSHPVLGFISPANRFDLTAHSELHSLFLDILHLLRLNTPHTSLHQMGLGLPPPPILRPSTKDTLATLVSSQQGPHNAQPSIAPLLSFSSDAMAMLKRHIPASPTERDGDGVHRRLAAIRTWLVHEVDVALVVAEEQATLAAAHSHVTGPALKELMDEIHSQRTSFRKIV